ncbi:unnamed protein product [Rhodiola kirilowii]
MASSSSIFQLSWLLCFLISCQFQDSQSKAETLIMSLRTESRSNTFFPFKNTKTASSQKNSDSRLSFHHNVTLTVSLTVGSPPQLVTMVLDTGSELSWLHCKKSPSNPYVFNPNVSTTYKPISCASPICRTKTRDFNIPPSCDDNKLCHSVISYADMSSIDGNLALETFRIENSTKPGTVFGCMDSGFSSNSEEDSKTTGLLGLNRGALSFVSQTGFPKFSYCISGRDSSGVLLFGETKFTWLKPLNYTPFVQVSVPLPYFDRVAYSVQLEGIRVGRKLLPLERSVYVPDHTGAGQTMVDSGTQFTFLLGPVYTALRSEFVNQTKTLFKVYEDSNYVFQGAMDLCYRVPPRRVRFLSMLPAVTLIFSGAEMSVSAERLVYRVENVKTTNGDGVYCFTFGNSDLLGIEAYLIGHHHQQNVWMEFDLEKSRVGIAQVQCDLASQRLGLTV